MAEKFNKSDLQIMERHRLSFNKVMNTWEEHWNHVHGKPYHRNTKDIEHCLLIVASGAIPHVITEFMRSAIKTGCKRLWYFLEQSDREDFRTREEIDKESLEKSEADYQRRKKEIEERANRGVALNSDRP